jgi:GNAT superfamily N-acetyltransferase
MILNSKDAMNMKIMKVLVADAAVLSDLATRSFVAAFGAHNTPSDMKQYLDTALSVSTLTLELQDPANNFLWAVPSTTCASTHLPISVSSVAPMGYVKVRRGEAPACVNGTSSRCVELERLYVAPELVGTGVGHMLLRHAMESTHQEGYQTMWLGVWEKNPRAIQFYLRHGFAEVGSHEFLLGSDLQKDIIMQLTTGS